MKQLNLTLLVLVCLSLSGGFYRNLHAQNPPVPSSISTLTDISGTGSKVALATSGSALWVQFVAPAGNTAVVRVGDTNVTTTRGTAMAAGSGFLLPRISGTNQQLYNLSQIFVLVQSGDSLTVSYGN